MLKINKLDIIWILTGRFSLLMFVVFFCNNLLSQPYSIVNYGSNIYMQGTGNPNDNPTISALGTFVNGNDGLLDGTIESENGHFWLSGNWNNQSNQNVFTNNSGFVNDGFVTLENDVNIQEIQGLSPTHFENLILNSFRKNLAVNNNQVNGNLNLNAILDLNSLNFILNNSNPASLNHITGFIKSESLPANYGSLQWNIGNSLGTYTIPFGSDNSNFSDLDLFITIKTPMDQQSNLTFATYPSDIYNYPLPTGASQLELEPFKVVDRYWIIQPSNPLFKPTADITFTYNSASVANGYNNLNLKTLKASRNNTDLAQWLDMQPRGTVSLNTVTIIDVQPNEFFAPWTLVNVPGPVANVFVPDAFTPDGDGLNDIFIPVFQANFTVVSYEFIVFDRWGIVQFSTKDPLQGWNGRKNNNDSESVNGVYSWVIIVKGYNTESNSTVELREKYVGRVTLFK